MVSFATTLGGDGLPDKKAGYPMARLCRWIAPFVAAPTGVWMADAIRRRDAVPDRRLHPPPSATLLRAVGRKKVTPRFNAKTVTAASSITADTGSTDQACCILFLKCTKKVCEP